MSFDASLFRNMPPHHYAASTVDPLSGLTIPKDVLSNIRWRRTVLAKANSSAAFRKSLLKASASSPIFWVNTFGWTFLQKQIDGSGKEKSVQGAGTHVPFVTWWVQDQALIELMDAIDNGHDALIHKSRDMGATWLVIALFQWYFQFRPSTTFLEISRKEILVDRRGDMDSLFQKHRYLMERQPEWMRPRRLVDTSLHLENQDIGSTIEGESTNENVGQASRKTAIFVDEAARIRELEQIEVATADTSACRIFNSTPQGPNTYFTRLYTAFSTGRKQGKFIMLPWWMHPQKGHEARLEIIRDAELANTLGVQVGDQDPVSPWILEEVKKRSRRNFAQNIRGEHGKAGDMFFDAQEIERHRRAYQRDPMFTGAIEWIEDFNEEEKEQAVAKQSKGSIAFLQHGGWNPWRFWVPLIDGRPNQQAQYIFGIDISVGSGASNSVITVLDHFTNMIVAKFWDAFTSPEDLAEEVAKAQIFFGGTRPARIVFEKNGPGISFGKKMVHKLKLPNIYYQEVVDGKSKFKTMKWGWHSSDTKKEILLRDYREALKLDEIINPCKEALDEAAEYTYNDKGKIDPGLTSSEDGGGKALHGDHVIADSLVGIGRAGLPKTEKERKYSPPRGSYAYRRKLSQRRQRDRTVWGR